VEQCLKQWTGAQKLCDQVLWVECGEWGWSACVAWGGELLFLLETAETATSSTALSTWLEWW